jgi:hypothetical protein
MRYGLDASVDMGATGPNTDPRRLAELAAEAEAAGRDGFFVSDMVFADRMEKPVLDPWIAPAAVAARTRRIRIGAMVTPLARRRPWQVARQAERRAPARPAAGRGHRPALRGGRRHVVDRDPVEQRPLRPGPVPPAGAERPAADVIGLVPG